MAPRTKPTAPTALQRKAALRVDNLVSQMGTAGQMEDSARYRENMLGKRERWPLLSVAETSMRKLNNAMALARDTRTANRRKSQGGF